MLTPDITEEDWKNSHKGKLWSTAVQKCFEAPFTEVAIQHLLFRIDQKYQKEIAQALTDREAEIVAGIEGMEKDEKGHWEVKTESEMLVLAQTNGYNSALKEIVTKITKGEV